MFLAHLTSLIKCVVSRDTARSSDIPIEVSTGIRDCNGEWQRELEGKRKSKTAGNQATKERRNR